MWRGAWRGYQRLLREYPMRTQMASAAVLAGGGDALAQFQLERRSRHDFDPRRCARFVAVSGLWVAPVVGRWLAFLGSRVAAGLHPRLAILVRVGVDQSCMAPFMLSTILLWLRLLEGDGLRRAVERLRADFWEIYLNGLKVWPLSMLINLSLVPPEFRLVFTQCVAFAWNTYLAWRTNRPTPTSADGEGSDSSW